MVNAGRRLFLRLPFKAAVIAGSSMAVPLARMLPRRRLPLTFKDVMNSVYGKGPCSYDVVSVYPSDVVAVRAAVAKMYKNSLYGKLGASHVGGRF